MGIRDLSVEWIAAPDEDDVGKEVVVGGALGDDLSEGDGGAGMAIADLGVHVERRAVEQKRQPHLPRGVRAEGVEWTNRPDDPIGALLGNGVDHLVGDLVERLLP